MLDRYRDALDRKLRLWKQMREAEVRSRHAVETKVSPDSDAYGDDDFDDDDFEEDDAQPSEPKQPEPEQKKGRAFAKPMGMRKKKKKKRYT